MIFYLLIFIVITLWIVGFVMLNDFRVRSGAIEFKKIMAIFPHPDDESLTVGGIIKNHELVILTKGEAGESGPYKNVDLKHIRSKEIQKSANDLEVSELILEDFGDGKLMNQKKMLTVHLDKLLTRSKPELVITYDLSGLYGHEDHIAVSQILTELIRTKHRKITLWYNTIPDKVLKMANLPTHMAKNPDFINRRMSPSVKVFSGLRIINKIKSAYAHKSQIGSFRNSIPKMLPIWFVLSMMPYEYFYENNFKKTEE